MTPGCRWRPMAEADLDAVVAIDAASDRGLAEERAVFADRLALFPAGCFAIDRDGVPAGYAVAHPWRAGAPPALHTLLASLPQRCDCLFLHDLVLLPAMRGQGLAATIIAEYVALAAARRLPAIELVALDGVQGFWRRHGFVPATAAGALPASYGHGATLMRRAITASAAPPPANAC